MLLHKFIWTCFIVCSLFSVTVGLVFRSFLFTFRYYSYTVHGTLAGGFRPLSFAYRKATLQKEKDEIQAWSKETGIDGTYLMPGFMRFGKIKMFDRWNTKGAPLNITPTPSV